MRDQAKINVTFYFMPIYDAAFQRYRKNKLEYAF